MIDALKVYLGISTTDYDLWLIFFSCMLLLLGIKVFISLFMIPIKYLFRSDK